MRYYIITDDCYLRYYIAVNEECNPELMPYTRHAEEITEAQYYQSIGRHENDIERVSDAVQSQHGENGRD